MTLSIYVFTLFKLKFEKSIIVDSNCKFSPKLIKENNYENNLS